MKTNRETLLFILQCVPKTAERVKMLWSLSLTVSDKHIVSNSHFPHVLTCDLSTYISNLKAIALKMEAVNSSETPANFHGATSQKSVVFSV